MNFRQYYEEELSHLRDTGRQYAEKHPKLAPFLGKAATDPDVERLLEGFAFLTAKLWHKVDDSLPEISYDLMNMIAPQYMTTQPSATILAFEPAEHFQRLDQIIKKDTVIEGSKNGMRYWFKTVYDTQVQPIKIVDIDMQRQDQQLKFNIHFQAHSGVSCDQLDLSKLRLYLSGDLKRSYLLYYALLNRLQAVSLSCGSQEIRCPQVNIKPVGLAQDELLLSSLRLPYRKQHLLQELFSFPEKFMFVDVTGLPNLQTWKGKNQFTLSLTLDLPLHLKFKASSDMVRLHCTPLINLFEMSAVPIRRNQQQVRYPVLLDDKRYGLCGVAQVKQVTGWTEGSERAQVYHPMASFQQNSQKLQDIYQVQMQPGKIHKMPRHYLVFPQTFQANALNQYETVSTEVLAYQLQVSEELGTGDIQSPLDQKDTALRYVNVTGLSLPVFPPLEGQFHWQLVATMASAFQGLVDVGHIKRLINTYHFAAPENLQSLAMAHQLSESIKVLDLKALERVHKGHVVRGNKTVITLQESAFVNIGEMYLFGTLLNAILQESAAMNSFNEVELVGLEAGGGLSWPTQFP